MLTATRASSVSSRRMRKMVAAGVALVNVVVIFGLWLHDGGITNINGVPSFLISSGRLSGLLGAYLLLLQVLLLARLRRVERLVGYDSLTRWHRLNGKVCFYLILIHVGLITNGYAMTDHLSMRDEMKVLLTLYSGIPDALIGAVLLIAVVVTSFVVVRRRLRYEAWYLIHLTAYLAVALAWFHQLPTGNDFLLNPLAAAWWTALYVITLALVIVFRLLLPIIFAFQYQLKVADVRPEGPNIVSLRLTGRRLEQMGARAGQFFLWRFLTPKLVWESHPFSLSAAPDGRSLRITVKNLGDFTSRLETIRPGTRVVGVGPFGLFTDEIRTRERVALIAGGVGITPLRALLEAMPGDVVLLYRVTRSEEAVFREELEALERERGIKVHYIVGRHDAPGAEYLLSPEHLRDLVPDIAGREIYICGPPAMTDLAEISVRHAGVPAQHVHTESFAFSPASSGGGRRRTLSSRARPWILAAFAAAAAVVLGRLAWLSTHSTIPAAEAVPTASTTLLAGGVSASPTPAATQAATSSGAAKPAAKTYTGSAVSTSYGTVQLRITVQNRRITNVTMTSSPDSARSQMLDTQAFSTLKSETLQAQSANIDTVSGATEFSNAYIQSLQNALSAAGL